MLGIDYDFTLVSRVSTILKSYQEQHCSPSVSFVKLAAAHLDIVTRIGQAIHECLSVGNSPWRSQCAIWSSSFIPQSAECRQPYFVGRNFFDKRNEMLRLPRNVLLAAPCNQQYSGRWVKPSKSLNQLQLSFSGYHGSIVPGASH